MSWKCPDCGMRLAAEIPADAPVYHRCPKQKLRRPHLAVRAVRYAVAVTRWRRAGSPERSDEEVSRILREHCQPCEYFDGGGGVCLHANCGCSVNSSPNAFLNKLKMATEACPIEKWTATAEIA